MNLENDIVRSLNTDKIAHNTHNSQSPIQTDKIIATDHLKCLVLLNLNKIMDENEIMIFW